MLLMENIFKLAVERWYLKSRMTFIHVSNYATRVTHVLCQQPVMWYVGGQINMYVNSKTEFHINVYYVTFKPPQGQSTAPTDKKFVQISAAPGDFSCGVTTSNSVSCWGDNHRKQCDPPNEKYSLVSTSRLSACGIKVCFFIFFINISPNCKQFM